MPLEERDAELAAIGRVLAGETGLLIEGPPGIGKTRLLAEARALASDKTVLSARGSELERDFPFAVVRQLLEPAARADLLVGAAALAAGVLTPGAPGEDDAGAALHGLYWLTANLAAERPLLILVDDAHWADLASLRWLAYLAQRLDGLPAALIIAARPAEAGESQAILDVLAANPAVELLEPHALSSAATARMVGPDADRDFTDACFRVSGGNPFLLGELLRELETVAPTAANAALVARQSSRTVSRAALARLRRLPPEATALARAVVILGDGTDPATAAALAGLDRNTAGHAADALEQAAILTSTTAEPAAGDSPGTAVRAGSGRVLSFVHPLVRESVYADLPAAERARGHARAAEVLAAAGAGAERVAIHRHEADPTGDPEAVAVLRDAAASARRRGATEVAISHLRRALDEPPPAALEPLVRRELGSAELQAGRYDAAAEHLQAASEDPRVAVELGSALQLAGRSEEAVAVLSRAIDNLTEEDRELGLLLQATRGAASQGNLAAAALARQAGFRFGADAEHPSTPGERLFVAALGYREAMRGRAEKARELALRTLGLIDDPGPSVPTIYVAPLALYFSGALEEATRAFTRMLEWARAHGSLLTFLQASHLRAGAWWRRGNLAEAEADAANAAGHPSFMIRPGVLVLIEIRLVQDDPDGAERLWREHGLHDDPLEGRAAVTTRHLGARIKAATGPHEEALAELLACEAAERAWGIRTPAYSTWRSDAVRLLTALGRTDEARELSRQDLARARAFGEPRALGIALRAAGLAAARDGGASTSPAAGDTAAGERETPGGVRGTAASAPRGAAGTSDAAASTASDALSLLAESIAVLRPSPARLELALSLFEHGAALRRSGQRVNAREPLTEAVAVAAECGATALAGKAHDELVAAGARPRRDPIESRSQLTASEARVARMAAEGMTNREIAQALFLTEKTIEVHLTSTYRKLDIASRSQLPRALAR